MGHTSLEPEKTPHFRVTCSRKAKTGFSPTDNRLCIHGIHADLLAAGKYRLSLSRDLIIYCLVCGDTVHLRLIDMSYILVHIRL